MHITGTHFNYFIICRRKLWLFANGINMEHTSDLVYAGKLIHETSYPDRAGKFTEIELGGVKIDYFDPEEKVVHEIKKSDKKEEAHIWQLKYYLYILEMNGVEGVSGRLEYPKQRDTTDIKLDDIDKITIGRWIREIPELTGKDTIPVRLKRSRCRNCSYFDFCWSGEYET
jgi:CRISPR-associated exonuclease Cas4